MSVSSELREAVIMGLSREEAIDFSLACVRAGDYNADEYLWDSVLQDILKGRQ